MNIAGTSFPYAVIVRIFTSFRPFKVELFRTEKEALKVAKMEALQANRDQVTVWHITPGTNQYDHTLLWQSSPRKVTMVRPSNWEGKR